MSDILTLTMNPAVDLSATAADVAPTHKIRCSEVRREAGGGGINVARVIRRLGGDCSALFPSGGCLGALLEGLVAREAITALPVPISAETRENFTATEAESGDQYRFVLPGPTLSEAEWRACLRQVEAAPAPRYVVASGSLPPGCPPAFQSELAPLVRGMGARLVVDSSGESLAAALAAGVHLCKPSLREFEGLVGERLPDQPARVAAAAEIVASGRAEAVALTLGEDGALLVTREGHWRAQPLDVQVASAVGAGDSFLAGFVWALASGEDWPGSFAWAVAAGTAAVLTPGTELAKRSDIEGLRPQVVIEALG